MTENEPEVLENFKLKNLKSQFFCVSVLQDFLLLMICQVSKMKEVFSSVNSVMQGCTNPRHQVTWATKFCMVALNICGSSVCNLFHVNFLALDICGSTPELHQVTSFLIAGILR
jgi:hypothetical protein